MDMFCCETVEQVRDIKTVTTPAADLMMQLAEVTSMDREVNSLKEADVQIHRLVGTVNDIPLDHLQIISFTKREATTEWAERDFAGAIAHERIQYSVSAKRSGKQVEISYAFTEPKIPKLPYLSLTLDTEKMFITATHPDILDLPQQAFTPLDPVSTMVFLTSGRPHEYDLKCLFIVLGFTALSCGPLLAVPGAGVAAFLICAGPATAAALVGCKKPKQA